MHKTWVAGLLILLAGCSEAPSLPENTEFEDLDLEATETTGVIRGVVIDASITPIEGATIQIINGPSTTSTADGAFGFDGLEAGSYFMEISRVGYDTVQQGTEVVAGVNQPAIVKVQLQFQPGTVPRFDILQGDGFIACSAATLLSVHPVCNDADLNDDRSKIQFFIEGEPDWFQSEVIWDSTQPLGDNLYQINYVTDADGGYTGERMGEGIGESPLIFAYDGAGVGSRGANNGNGIDLSMFSGGPAAETGVAIDQQFTAFIPLFYNFVPIEGWSFIADGAPTIPQ